MELETKYYKDLNHSYLVIKHKKEETESASETQDPKEKADKRGNYQNRMITGNRMKKLLPCRIQSINGETCYYYEISSRQNVRQAFANRPLDLEQLMRLFESIYQASVEIREYLLEDSHILLEPQFIFLTPGTGEYAFVYYPQAFDWNRAMVSFAEYLVERADHEDDQAIEMVYGVYESILSGTFILSEILARFPGRELPLDSCRQRRETAPPALPGEKYATIQKVKAAKETEERRVAGTGQGTGTGQEENTEDQRDIAAWEDSDLRAETGGQDTGYSGNNAEAGRSNAQYGTDCQEDASEYKNLEEGEEWEGEGKNYGRRATVILLILAGTAAAAVFGVRCLFLLTPEENLLSIAGSVALMAVSALLLLHLLTCPVTKRRFAEREECGRETGRRLSERKDAPLESEASFPEGGTPGYRWASPPPAWSPTLHRQPVEWTGTSGPVEEVSENTVFFETSFTANNRKLYGINRGNRYHIDLTRLPCTVGKMAGGVDFVIKDDSVSRVHARITQENDEIQVTDLNSTNGTFKNGLQLEPNETVCLEPGDEIRFGRMTFCFR